MGEYMDFEAAANELRPMINHSALNDKGLYVKDIKVTRQHGSDGYVFYIYNIWFRVKGVGDSKIQEPAISLDLNEDRFLVQRLNVRLENIISEVEFCTFDQQTIH